MRRNTQKILQLTKSVHSGAEDGRWDLHEANTKLLIISYCIHHLAQDLSELRTEPGLPLFSLACCHRPLRHSNLLLGPYIAGGWFYEKKRHSFYFLAFQHFWPETQELDASSFPSGFPESRHAVLLPNCIL